MYINQIKSRSKAAIDLCILTISHVFYFSNILSLKHFPSHIILTCMHFAQMHIHIHIHIHMRICIYIQICTCTSPEGTTQDRNRALNRACLVNTHSTHIYMFTHLLSHIQLSHMCILLIHTYRYTCTHTFSYTHIHTCTSSQGTMHDSNQALPHKNTFLSCTLFQTFFLSCNRLILTSDFSY